jgi:hypothetical protein
LLELPQGRRGIEAELLGEEAPVPLVGSEGLGLPASAIEAFHEERHRSLSQG